MRIPQSLDEVRRMSPDEQKQAGEMLGRLLVLDPQQLSRVTKISPEELQGLMQPQTGQQQAPRTNEEEPAGATNPVPPMPTQGYASKKAPGGKSGRGNEPYGVLSNLVKDPEGMTIRDTRTGASRSAVPGDPIGPTEVLMSGNQILKAGLRARANLRIRSQGRV